MSKIDDFFKLPLDAQRGFISQFRLVLDSAIDCGTHYNVFGESMTILQYKTIKDIVEKYNSEHSK